jgi:hypothetical protein
VDLRGGLLISVQLRSKLYVQILLEETERGSLQNKRPDVKGRCRDKVWIVWAARGSADGGSESKG